MFQTLPLNSFASEKEKLFNEDAVDEVVFNPQLVDESLRLEQWPDELYADTFENCEPQIVNNELVYDNAFNDNADIGYSLENSGSKESIVVYEPTGCNCYDFIISADGLVPETESGKSIVLLDESSGKTVFIIQPTFIMDSYNGEHIDGEEHTTYDNYYNIDVFNIIQ